MKQIVKALSLLLALTVLAGCGQAHTRAPHSISFDGLESVQMGNDSVSGYYLIRGIKYRGYCTPCFSKMPDRELGPVVAYYECPGLSVGWQYITEIEDEDPEKYLLMVYEDGSGLPSWDSGSEILVADNVKEIPRWIEDMRELYQNSTAPGSYSGVKDGYTILERSSYEQVSEIDESNVTTAESNDCIEHPDYVSRFGLAYDAAQEQYVPLLTWPKDGYMEQWTAEQIIEYVGYDLIDKLDNYFGEGKEQYAWERPVYFYEDGTVSMYTEFSYVTPGSEGAYGTTLTIWVNHDRMDESVEWKYPIGKPNNIIQGVPVWLGWSRNYYGAFDDPDTKTDITLLAAFSLDGTYYFLEHQPVSESGDGEGVFFGALQTILTLE